MKQLAQAMEGDERLLGPGRVAHGTRFIVGCPCLTSTATLSFNDGRNSRLERKEIGALIGAPMQV
jgi:hypothetical protein